MVGVSCVVTFLPLELHCQLNVTHSLRLSVGQLRELSLALAQRRPGQMGRHTSHSAHGTVCAAWTLCINP